MSDQNHAAKADGIPAWSWVVAAIGLVFIVALTGFMLYRGFAVDSAAPEIVIEVDEIVPGESGYLVKIRVTNYGGVVAADLVVEGILSDGTATIETSEVTLDYVPVGSQRQAGLFFANDPQAYELQLRPKGYTLP